MATAFQEILDYVLTLEIIDTHEHLPINEDVRLKETDILQEYLSSYLPADLISAGMKLDDLKKAQDHSLPLLERWNLVEPYWEASRYTGYGQVLDITVRELYGVEKVCRATIEELDEKFQRTLKGGQLKKVLKEKSKIRIALEDSHLGCDREYFRSVWRLDNFIYPATGRDIVKIEQDTGMRITCFDDYLEVCEVMLDKVFDEGAVALKQGLAYQRSLYYPRADKKDAEEEFNKAFTSKHYPDMPFVTGESFQSYIMHHILNLANKRHLTYMFHTGHLAGNGNYIANSDPALLSNLFMEYPDVDFDVMHIGYPYYMVLASLAKMFANVYIDMCWAHIISPPACVNALLEYLETVPVNKISAFGGDLGVIDPVYGHQYMARVNVSKALAIKVEGGLFDVDKAKEIAEMLFFKNPYRIFKLEGKI